MVERALTNRHNRNHKRVIECWKCQHFGRSQGKAKYKGTPVPTVLASTSHGDASSLEEEAYQQNAATAGVTTLVFKKTEGHHRKPATELAFGPWSG